MYLYGMNTTTHEGTVMTQNKTILDQSGLPADLIAKMKSVVSVTNERCYLHPESPTGYVGRGKWCEHRPGHIVKQLDAASGEAFIGSWCKVHSSHHVCAYAGSIVTR